MKKIILVLLIITILCGFIFLKSSVAMAQPYYDNILEWFDANGLQRINNDEMNLFAQKPYVVAGIDQNGNFCLYGSNSEHLLQNGSFMFNHSSSSDSSLWSIIHRWGPDKTSFTPILSDTYNPSNFIDANVQFVNFDVKDSVTNNIVYAKTGDINMSLDLPIEYLDSFNHVYPYYYILDHNDTNWFVAVNSPLYHDSDGYLHFSCDHHLRLIYEKVNGEWKKRSALVSLMLNYSNPFSFNTSEILYNNTTILGTSVSFNNQESFKNPDKNNVIDGYDSTMVYINPVKLPYFNDVDYRYKKGYDLDNPVPQVENLTFKGKSIKIAGLEVGSSKTDFILEWDLASEKDLFLEMYVTVQNIDNSTPVTIKNLLFNRWDFYKYKTHGYKLLYNNINDTHNYDFSLPNFKKVLSKACFGEASTEVEITNISVRYVRIDKDYDVAYYGDWSQISINWGKWDVIKGDGMIEDVTVVKIREDKNIETGDFEQVIISDENVIVYDKKGNVLEQSENMSEFLTYTAENGTRDAIGILKDISGTILELPQLMALLFIALPSVFMSLVTAGIGLIVIMRIAGR